MKKLIILSVLLLSGCSKPKTKEVITVGEVKDNFRDIELCSWSTDCDNIEYFPCQGVQDWTFRQKSIEEVCERIKQ